MMEHTRKARISKAIIRAVLLGLGLSSVFAGGGLAFADDASLSGNTKIVDQDTSGSVVGVRVPYGSPATVEKNKLIITGRKVGEIREIYYKSNADSQAVIADNRATITDTTVNGNYYGIYKDSREGKLKRTGNQTSFQDSTVVKGWAIGNYISENLKELTSQDNIISLTNKSTVGSWLVQDFAYGNQGKFTNNQIILDDSKVLGPIRGEKFIGLKNDDNDATIAAKGNSITLKNNSYAGTAVAVDVGGTKTSSDASENTLDITGGSALLFGTPVMGSVTASGNTVTLQDSQAGILLGALAEGDASVNTVTLSGNSVVNYQKTSETLKNQGIDAQDDVPFSGSDSMVIGAMSFSGKGSNNVINVTGNVDLTDARLYGAVDGNWNRVAKGSGNTLRIGYDGSKAAAWDGAKENQVAFVGAFDKIELWQGSWGEKPMLHITDDLDDHSGLADTTVDVSHLSFTDDHPARPNSETVLIQNDKTQYKAGENVNLEESGRTFGYTLGNPANASLQGSFVGKAGTSGGKIVFSTGDVQVGRVDFGQVTWGTTPLSLEKNVTYDFKDSTIHTGSISFAGLDGLRDGKNSMTLLDTTRGQAVNLTEGNLSGKKLPYTVGTTLEGQGQAYVEDSNVQCVIDLRDKTVHTQPQTHMTVIGQDAGLAAVMGGSDLVIGDMMNLKNRENGSFTFASVLAGENRYETGSSLRTNGWNGHAGFGWKKDFGRKGVGETGLFYDYGDGNYRTYDNGLYGHGDLRYRGAGLFGRFTTPSDVFVEGSFRTGRVDNKARHVLVDGAGNGYDYDTDGRYTAFHVGAGRTVPINSRDSLEWYGRYFYTHVNGDDFETGGQYHLDSVDSSLVRLGARWQRKSGQNAWYAGAAYEYEFDGEATGTADGRSIRSASIQGSSARLETGMVWNKDNWTIQTGVHGYMGKHRGIGGSVDLQIHL
ncbi:autotransporter outer membrane beta-barrel domain-containing protein [Acidaminococcus sp.]|uniref:autotransporter outer membrane beta-barrel domain-containing protein n=1 Tax=Acidaminococcus sp. TaxID=1872103 RepID=UPI003D7E7F44